MQIIILIVSRPQTEFWSVIKVMNTTIYDSKTHDYAHLHSCQVLHTMEFILYLLIGLMEFSGFRKDQYLNLASWQNFVFRKKKLLSTRVFNKHFRIQQIAKKCRNVFISQKGSWKIPFLLYNKNINNNYWYQVFPTHDTS